MSMFDNPVVTVPVDRYDALIRAERERNAMFGLLADLEANYGTISRDHIVLICKLFDIRGEHEEL